jgi:hypothetical protein
MWPWVALFADTPGTQLKGAVALTTHPVHGLISEGLCYSSCFRWPAYHHGWFQDNSCGIYGVQSSMLTECSRYQDILTVSRKVTSTSTCLASVCPAMLCRSDVRNAVQLSVGLPVLYLYTSVTLLWV